MQGAEVVTAIASRCCRWSTTRTARPREYAAGEYVFHPTHGHVHFADYAFYRLYEVAPDGGLGAQVAGGEKVSFCLIDAAPFDMSLPGASALPVLCPVRTAHARYLGRLGGRLRGRIG